MRAPGTGLARLWLLGLTLATGCLVDIDYSDTRFRCTASAECPEPQSCVDGLCQEPGVAEPDAAPPPDAPVPDAAPDPPQLFQRRVLSAADDSEEFVSDDPAIDGTIDRGSTDLELGDDGPQGPQIVGIRFAGVDLEPGTQIVSAHIQFTVDETSSVPTEVQIRAEASDDAAALTTNLNDLSSRQTTEAAVTWSLAPWETIADAGPDQRTPDLAEVLAEVIERPGWASGNALVVLIRGTGVRTAESFNGDSALAPLLQVEYFTAE